MDSTPERRTTTLNRRQLLASGGIGIGTVALSGAGVTAAPDRANTVQIGTPPPAPPPATTVEAGETAADVAARLNYDVDAIFRFVADEVHYESYDGVLRGAKGTLWARAGNSADQAILLGALLEAAEIPYRFAVGALPAAQAEALAAQMVLTAEISRGRYEASATAAMLSAAGLEELPAEPPQLSPDDQARMDEKITLATEAFERAGESATALSAMIGEALIEAGVELPPLAAPTLTGGETDQHVWIQVADGPAWIDLDPSLPGAEPGTAVTEPASTFDAVPDDWNHSLTIRVAADENIGGTLSRRDVVTLTTTSQRAVDATIGISMAPAESLGEVGLGITQLFTGQKTIFPSIIMGDELAEASQPMIFATDGASTIGVFDEGGPIAGAAEGETVAVWLVVEITSPGVAPVVVERALLDRVPARDRATATFVPESVAPISVATNVMGEEMLSEFNALTLIQVECARIPSQHILARFQSQTMFGALETLGLGLPGLRNTLGLEQETQAGAWSYPSGPNVTAFTYYAAELGTGDGELRVSADLLHRQRTSAPLAGGAISEAAVVHPSMLSGVLDAVAEEILLAPETRGEAATTSSIAPQPSIVRIFELAAETGVGITVVSTAGDLSRVTADEISVALMTAALERGAIVVVPEQPVDLDGVPFTGWWVIDPVTGRTYDQLQNGKSFATSRVSGAPRIVSAQDTLAWYARWAQYMAENIEFFACLGMTLGLVALIVETKILWPVSQGAAAITGAVVIFGAGGLSLC